MKYACKKPSIWKILLLVLLVASLVIFIWNPLSEDANRQAYFEKKISEMISGKDEAIVKISELTNFKWEKVYFKYIILPKIKVGVIVKFYADTDITIMDLPFPKYYIEEPYIKGSLDRKWLNYGDYILIKASTHIRSRSIILSEPSD